MQITETLGGSGTLFRNLNTMMKLKLLPLALVFWVFCMSAMEEVHAQEAGAPFSETEDSGSEVEHGDQSSIIEPSPYDTNLRHTGSSNSDSISQTSSSAQSLSATSVGGAPSKVTSTPTSNKEESQDEDVLTFNFLYYIIQKFKMSDIVDK